MGVDGRIYDAQRKRFANAKGYQSSNQMSPYFGKNPLEPSSLIPTIPLDPTLAEPLPSGRFIDPNIPTDVAAARAAQGKEAMGNTKDWLKQNSTQMVQEQSIIDKGKSMLQRLFDYQDDADLQIAGLNLSPVESTWDGFMRHYIGFYDLLSIGYGGLLSAAPGGMRTLSYDELSAGRSVGDVLSGNMDREAAPSPGQIFVASTAEAAARVRRGDGRLSDLLALSGVAGLAALLAESSPLQQEGFDIMDKEQRDKAFGAGWEKWMSGTTDFGLAFADPLIGAGVVGKVARAGLLGQVGAAKIGARFGQYSAEGLTELSQKLGMGDTGLMDEATRYAQQAPGAKDPTRDIYAGKYEKPVIQLRGLKDTDPVPVLQNAWARFAYDVTVRDATGAKKMSPLQIEKRAEFKALHNRADVADLLHRTDSPVVATLIMQDIMGTPGARQMLEKIAPASADATYKMRFAELHVKRLTEPAKIEEATQALSRMKENLEQMRGSLADQMTGKTVTDPEFAMFQQRAAMYQQSIEQADELIAAIKHGDPIDRMNPQSAFYEEAYTDAVMADLHRQSDVVTQALNRELSDTGAQAQNYFPMADNPYARMVTRSRERRAKAGYQYAMEGTNILPRKTLVTNPEGGEPIRKWEFWSPSQFEGTSRFQRNARVWRWFGTATPSGYISLKGTSLVNQEREIDAVLDMDIFKGPGVVVTRPKRDKFGQILDKADVETRVVGGIERRNELRKMFTEALNDPDKDVFVSVMDIERAIMNELADLYGIADGEISNLLAFATKRKSAVLDMVRQRGFFIDPVDGGRHYSAYLDSQLANGTYMQNFQAIEKMLKREYERDSLKTFRGWMDNIGGFTGGIYDTYNNIWRPATLLRLSYTQRNVLEGMVRAMAFYGSLAPVVWPVKATTFGVMNKVARGRAAKSVAAAQKALDGSEFMEMRRAIDEATIERTRWAQAFVVKKETKGKDGLPVIEEEWYVPTGPGGVESNYVKTTKKEIAKNLKKAQDEEARLDGIMRSSGVSKFDDAVAGTEFGTWRRQNLTALEDEIKRKQAYLDDVIAEDGSKAADGSTISIRDPEFAPGVAQIQGELYYLETRYNRIAYDPTAALAEYQAHAGRQRRIGSGSSLGPDGNQYQNAYGGPLEQIARTNMSADTTIKQGLALQGDVLGNIFRRQMLRTNEAIRWDSLRPEAWIRGMQQVIEANSSSQLVQAMARADFDIDTTLNWLLTSKEGIKWFREYRSLQQASDGELIRINTIAERFAGETSGAGKVASSERQLKIAGKEEQIRLKQAGPGARSKKVGENVTTTEGTVLPVIDPESARAFLVEVQNRLMDQMQRQPGFLNLLKARAAQKEGLSGEVIETVEGSDSIVNATSIKAVIDSLDPNVRENLGFVQGSELIELGARRPMEVWTKWMNKAFRVLGTIPEDAVTRGPFYAARFKDARDDMIEMYLIRTGQGDKIRRGKRTTRADGKVHQGTIEHDSFKIPVGEINRIYYQAHRRALADTREWMYTIERRTNLGKYGEWVFPFVSAAQNSVTVTGKLLWKQPWLAPFIADLWRAPERAGFEDDEGNLILPMPLSFLTDKLQDMPNLPVIGGILTNNDMLTIPKEALNLWIPETGYGPIPRPGPWVQVSASLLMQNNMFPIETPQVLKNLLGDEQATEVYTSIKEWVFGEDQGMSSTPLAADKLLPAYLQKVWYSKQELSVQYGYQYQLQWATQMYRYNNQERPDRPTPEEIGKRATNMMWFQAFGNYGIPTPFTPYPIVTRPVVQNPVEQIQQQYKMYLDADPENASLNFYNDYGDLAMLVSNTKITRNIGGIDPAPEAVSDAQTFAPLIADVANDVSNKEVLGILVNNRSSNSEYEDNSYEWQKGANIPGTNEPWRQVQAPDQSIAERQRITGWVEFRKFKDQLSAMMRSAGVTSMNGKAGLPYREAQARFIDSMKANPDRDGWVADYELNGGSKAVDAVRIMERAVNDETFVRVIGGHDPQLLSSMADYVKYRQMTRDLVEQSGKSITAPENAAVLDAWLTIRQNLTVNPRFSEIMNLYLYNDENPVDVGVVGRQRVVEVTNGG